MSIKALVALFLGSVLFVVGGALLVAVLDPHGQACPSGKTLVMMPVGKVTVPECV